MSSFISINSCKTLGIYRMSYFLRVFFYLGCALHTQSGFFFFKTFKTQNFCSFLAQLVKKLHQWSLYVVIKNILLIIFITKWLLSNIWLRSYKQNSFGYFEIGMSWFEVFEVLEISSKLSITYHWCINLTHQQYIDNQSMKLEH